MVNKEKLKKEVALEIFCPDWNFEQSFPGIVILV